MHIGQSGVIIKLLGNPAMRQRLLDMGFVKGTKISVVNIAPLGDPMKIQIRGYHVAVRKKDAYSILVELTFAQDTVEYSCGNKIDIE